VLLDKECSSLRILVCFSVYIHIHINCLLRTVPSLKTSPEPPAFHVEYFNR
jgi:hypothetical protein